MVLLESIQNLGVCSDSAFSLLFLLFLDTPALKSRYSSTFSSHSTNIYSECIASDPGGVGIDGFVAAISCQPKSRPAPSDTSLPLSQME